MTWAAVKARTVYIGVAAIVVVLVVVGSFLASDRHSSAQTGSSSKGSPITILWIGDTTGPVQAAGTVELAAVKGAAAYYNSLGGIDGHPVVVHAVSDNGDPTIAATVLTQQLASSTPTMVWAGSYGGDSAGLIPILARHKVFSIGLIDGRAQCQTNAEAMCPHEWVVSMASDVAPRAAVAWMKQRRATTVGLLEETTNLSAAETPRVLKAASAGGITVKRASFPATAVDLTPQLQSLQQAGAQVIYSEGLGSAQYVLTARANLGWDVPVLFDPSASSQDLAKLVPAANIKNAFELNQFEQDASLSDPGLATMLSWAKRYGDVSTEPVIVASTGWDPVVALAAAVQEAGGSLDVDKLGAAMLRLPPTDPLRTLTHRLGFTEDDHENVLGGVSDYAVAPVGPLVGGRVQSP